MTSKRKQSENYVKKKYTKMGAGRNTALSSYEDIELAENAGKFSLGRALG